MYALRIRRQDACAPRWNALPKRHSSGEPHKPATTGLRSIYSTAALKPRSFRTTRSKYSACQNFPVLFRGLLASLAVNDFQLWNILVNVQPSAGINTSCCSSETSVILCQRAEKYLCVPADVRFCKEVRWLLTVGQIRYKRSFVCCCRLMCVWISDVSASMLFNIWSDRGAC